LCGTAVNNAKVVAKANNSFLELTLANSNETTTIYLKCVENRTIHVLGTGRTKLR